MKYVDDFSKIIFQKRYAHIISFFWVLEAETKSSEKLIAQKSRPVSLKLKHSFLRNTGTPARFFLTPPPKILVQIRPCLRMSQLLTSITFDQRSSPTILVFKMPNWMKNILSSLIKDIKS
jgi:hypothetical protein